MGCAVTSKYIQLYCTINQVVFTESEIKSSKLNQLVKVNMMFKYILAHRLLLVILILNPRLCCCEYVLSYGPGSPFS